MSSSSLVDSSSSSSSSGRNGRNKKMVKKGKLNASLFDYYQKIGTNKEENTPPQPSIPPIHQQHTIKQEESANENTKKNQQNMMIVENYISSLEGKDLTAFRIAEQHFAEGFRAEKTTGFLNWLRSRGAWGVGCQEEL